MGDEQAGRCTMFRSETDSGYANLRRGTRCINCAGEDCSFTGGYSGWRIGVEEMKVRALVHHSIPSPKTIM
jgi:hypothetical protein